ncbi:uncharacterized protein V1516DRAFT_667411 [Lipomyces oligophaga]|uniref:uncharacterized protein n=1 Tax=Lipomyces oligophaga TaxID=45792 RepID=UPI0034CD2994
MGDRYPSFGSYLSSTRQAFILKGLGNLIGQWVISYREGPPYGALDSAAVAAFALWAIFHTPIFMTWTAVLDNLWPTLVKSKTTSAVLTKKEEEDKEKIKQPSTRKSNQTEELSQSNIMIKVILTESLFSAVMNAIFIGFICYLKTGDMDLVKLRIREDLPEIQMSSMKLWPLVTFVCLVYVPVDKRVLVRSLVGVLWTVYLSLESA